MWIIVLLFIVLLFYAWLTYFRVREKIELDAARRIRDAQWRVIEGRRFYEHWQIQKDIIKLWGPV